MMERILDLLYPRRCALCLSSVSRSVNKQIELCPNCELDLSLIGERCHQCGIPLPPTHVKQLCGQCIQKKPFYDQVISLYHYQNPLIWLIQEMKFHKKARFARLLSELMCLQLCKLQANNRLSLPDVLIPVPLHYKRQFERGFNQAEELSKRISKALPCPLDTQFIERTVHSPQQSGLNAQQRKKNVKGIFSVKQKTHHYQHVTIIDDVMSTGSTLNEMARVLKQAGVNKVDVWVLARASHH